MPVVPPGGLGKDRPKVPMTCGLFAGVPGLMMWTVKKKTIKMINDLTNKEEMLKKYNKHIFYTAK